MKFSNTFRIAWWIGLLTVLTGFLATRVGDMHQGRGTTADTVVSLMWFALVLVPIFSEIKFGDVLELKQEIKDTKQELRDGFAGLRMELQNAVDVTTQINPQFNLVPPPDNRLPEMEGIVKRAVSDALARHGAFPAASPVASPAAITDDVRLLFETRRAMEVELRRLGALAFPDPKKPVPIIRLARALMEDGVIPASLFDAIRDVYAICTPAIHGEPVTSAQVAFVREAGRPLVDALRKM